MKKYVDAEELLKHKRKMRGFDLCEEFWDEAVLCEDIKNAPAADVEEVVRCKNCKHRDTDGCPMMFWDVCGALMGETEDDGFCSYGESEEQ